MTFVNPPISNQKFGIYFAGFFALASLWSFYRQYSLFVVLLFSIASAIFIVLTMIAPLILSWPNRLWFSLGELLGKITGPLVLGIIFFGIITPVGVLGKWFGRDALVLRKTKKATYWIERHTEARPPTSFNNQF